MEQINQKKTSKDSIGKFCFFTALFIELLIVILDKSDYIIQYEGKYFQLTFLLFFIKVLLTKYNSKEWGIMFGFGLLGVISYLATGRNEIIRLVMMIAASKNIVLEQAMKLTFFTTLAGVGGLIFLSASGIYGKLYMISDFRGTGEELRYCLGLGHPNALHCMIWALIVLSFFLYLDKMKWYHFLLICVINILFYLLTDSKTGVIVSFGTIMLAILMKYSAFLREKRLLYYLGIAGTWAMALFSVLAATVEIGITQRWFVKIDQIVTGRISLACNLTPVSTWSLFSDRSHEAYQDMGFVRLFDWYGYIPGIIAIVVITIMIWYCYRNKKYKWYIVIVSFVVYSVFEAHAISVYLARNYMFMLLIGTWTHVFSAEGRSDFYIWNILSSFRKVKKGK